MTTPVRGCNKPDGSSLQYDLSEVRNVTNNASAKSGFEAKILIDVMNANLVIIHQITEQQVVKNVQLVFIMKNMQQAAALRVHLELIQVWKDQPLFQIA